MDETIYQAVLRGDLLADWPLYALMLRSVSADPQQIQLLHGLWRRTMNVTKREQPSRIVQHRQLNTSLTVSAGDGPKIEASTASEFNALIRMFVQRSGMLPNQIAIKMPELSRSQVYSLLKEGRTGLPTKVEQVRAILRACRVPDQEIAKMTGLWGMLAMNKPARSTAVAVANTATNTTAVTVVPPVDAMLVPIETTATPDVSNRTPILTLSAMAMAMAVWVGTTAAALLVLSAVDAVRGTGSDVGIGSAALAGLGLSVATPAGRRWWKRHLAKLAVGTQIEEGPQPV
jgi:hypothetical protein